MDRDKIAGKIAELVEIINILRAPDGCPWDREQTAKSAKKYVLEEVYELLEAIETNDHEAMTEELGDTIFMLLFLAHTLEKDFEINPCMALACIKDKMIRRHPHIFGDAQVENSDEVMDNWRKTKLEEARKRGEIPSILGKLPKTLPALQRAFRVGERAARIGFDWKDHTELWDKLSEEERELKQAITEGKREKIEEEFGDILFTMCNLARHISINPEDALNKSINKFISRFTHMEKLIHEAGLDINSLDIVELDRWWNKTKEIGDAN